MNRPHTEPHSLPQDSAEHLAWRLRGVRPEAPAGWFLFDGAQIATIMRGLRVLQEGGR